MKMHEQQEEILHTPCLGIMNSEGERISEQQYLRLFTVAAIILVPMVADRGNSGHAFLFSTWKM